MKFHYILSLMILFLSSLSAYDISQTKTPPVFRWTVEDMRIPSVEEWTKHHPDSPEIIDALNKYHQTGRFSQTNQEFIAHPTEYIDNRLKALDEILSSVKNYATDNCSDLKSRVQKKQNYLKALPHPLEPRTIKADLFGDARDLPLRDIYWFERLDPLHRFGPTINTYMAEWEASSVPNYYLFLETVENDRILNTLAPFSNYVTYYKDQEERNAHKAEFKNGRIYWQGELLSNKKENGEQEDALIFVIPSDEQVYINRQEIYSIHHSSEFAGGTLLSAGEIAIEEGKIIHISNSSGHYKPTPKDMLPALRIFAERYGSLEGVALFLKNAKFSFNAVYDAQKYLETQGKCIPQSINEEGWTPLHIAMAEGHYELAQELLEEYGYALEAHKDSKIYVNPWVLVVEHDDPKWVDFLLKAGLDPFYAPEKESAAVDYFAHQGRIDLIERIVELLPDRIEEKLRNSRAILYAAANGSRELIEYLLDKGLSLDKRDGMDRTIMHYAAGGSLEVMEWLESKGLGEYLFHKDIQGKTPLHIAAGFGTPEILEHLLNKGGSLHELDGNLNNLLLIAIKQQSLNNFKWLMQVPGINDLLLEPNKDGQTALHIAAVQLKTSEFKKLLQNIDMDQIDLQTNSGLTAYGMAINNRSPFSLSNKILLLDYGASPLIKDENGFAPWEKLVEKQRTSDIVILLRHAQLDKDQLLQDMLDYAELNQLPYIYNMLLSLKAEESKEEPLPKYFNG